MRRLTIELLDTNGFIFHVDALDIALHFSTQELADCTLSLSSLGCQYYRCFVFDRHKDSVRTFILDSNLTRRTRLKSTISCCMYESNDVQPKRFGQLSRP